MPHKTPALTVREERDAEGDLYWALVATTYDRKALDDLAEAFKVRLDIIVEGPRD